MNRYSELDREQLEAECEATKVRVEELEEFIRDNSDPDSDDFDIKNFWRDAATKARSSSYHV